MDETNDTTGVTGADSRQPRPADEPSPEERVAAEPASEPVVPVVPQDEPMAAEPGSEMPTAEAVASSELPPIAVSGSAGLRRWDWRSGLLAAVLAVFVAGSVAAVVGDWVTLPLVPRGVTVAGSAVGGLDEAALRTAIEEGVSKPAMQPVTVTGDSRTWLLDPRGIVTVDADAMVREAYAAALHSSLFDRLYDRISRRAPNTALKPVYVVDRTALSSWITRTAADIDRSAVDATRAVVAYAIKITPEVVGAKVDRPRALEVLSAALAADAVSQTARTTALPIDSVRPKVLASNFSRAIVVSLSRTTVYLYDGSTLVKSWRCAPGQPAWPTPTGDFRIVRKQANAPWINPHSAWSASMPESIPGGPNNPMGDRKIAIDYPGVFLHGIPPSEFGSIGTFASHGCMRMMPSSIHDLYPRVKVGDPVFIRA